MRFSMPFVFGLCACLLLAGCSSGSVTGPGGNNGTNTPIEDDGKPDNPDKPDKPDKPDVSTPACDPDKCDTDQVCAGANCCDPVQACGDACCSTGDSCFAGQCVTPGKECLLGECDDGAYCEMALSDEPPAAETFISETCQANAQIAKGRCLVLPAACSGDADDGLDCIHEVCEYKPKFDKLRTKLLWSWGSDYVIPELPEENRFAAKVDENDPRFVKAKTFTNRLDVWSTAVVGRVADSNCDGEVDEKDTPNIIVVSADTKRSICSNRNGKKVRSLNRKPFDIPLASPLQTSDDDTVTDISVPSERSMENWSTDANGKLYCPWIAVGVGKLTNVTSERLALAGDSGKHVNADGTLSDQCETGTIPGTLSNECHRGVIRVLNGKTGQELETISAADTDADSVAGFTAITPVLANIDNVPGLDIVAVDSDGHINAFNVVTQPTLIARSQDRIESAWMDNSPVVPQRNNSFGMGGYLSIGRSSADDPLMVSYGEDVFVLEKAPDSSVSIVKINSNASGFGGELSRFGSYFADIDPDIDGLELVSHGNILAFNKDASGEISVESLWDGSLLQVEKGEDWTDGTDRSINMEDYFSATGSLLRELKRHFTSSVADFDGDGVPEMVAVFNGYIFVFDAKTHVLRAPPYRIEVPEILDRDDFDKGIGWGGTITVANMKDFSDDLELDGGKFRAPEVGLALQFAYVTLRVKLDPVDQNVTTGEISMNWAMPTVDESSSVTGSTVFDFEGDGIAEVVYNDQCYQWVFDGQDGHVKFAMPTQSFTATESSVVADVNGNGHAEIIVISNGVNLRTWRCLHDGHGLDSQDVAYGYYKAAPSGVLDYGRPGWFDAAGKTDWEDASGRVNANVAKPHRGVAVFGDISSSWVGTRQLWNQHAYSVTNICDGLEVDSSENAICEADENVYGAIPSKPKSNWLLKTRAEEENVPFLNNFRQNIQGEGRFDTSDAAVSLRFRCDSSPTAIVTVQNKGRNILPAGARVEIYFTNNKGDQTGDPLAEVATTSALAAGQSTDLEAEIASIDHNKRYIAKLRLDPDAPLFIECQNKASKQAAIDNNLSDAVRVGCITGSRLR